MTSLHKAESALEVIRASPVDLKLTAAYLHMVKVYLRTLPGSSCYARNSLKTLEVFIHHQC